MRAKDSHGFARLDGWLGDAISLLVALFVAPLPLFLVGLFMPLGFFEAFFAQFLADYARAVGLGAVGVALIAVPGLALLHRMRRDDLNLRLLLGAGVAVVAVALGLWVESGENLNLGLIHTLWPASLVGALGVGLLGSFLHWHLSRWLQARVRKARVPVAPHTRGAVPR